MSRFVQIDRDTAYLLPPSVQEWLPEDHLARFIVETVEQLDLSALERQYAGRGVAAFPPAMLLALLFYGYATGQFSSRRIERATYDSVAFRFIAANTHPDHDTIAAFRKRFLPQLKNLFVQILLVARALELLKVGNVSLDGTKLKANASRHRALSYGYASKIEAQLQAEVEQLLQMAEQADRRAVPDGMDVPAELARREVRLAAIRQAKAEIEARAQERFAREQQVYDAKVAAREERQKKSGKKPGGKPPAAPVSGPRDTDQLSLTDGESRIMKTAGGGFEQAYNAQALTDVHTKLIVSAFVTQQATDVGQIEPALASLQQLPEVLGTPEHLVADTGYMSRANVQRCEQAQVTPLIAIKRDEHHPPVLERFAPAPADPTGRRPDAALAPPAGRRPGQGVVRQAQDHQRTGVRGDQARAGLQAVPDARHRGRRR